jgi:hypothetical protein
MKEEGMSAIKAERKKKERKVQSFSNTKLS